MKKSLSIILSLILAFGFMLPAFADGENGDGTLRFNDDGGFRIMQVADIQDGPFLLSITKDYLEAALYEVKPDLVVLTGDNISAGAASIGIHSIDLLLTEIAIDRFMSVFEEYGVPVAVVFGNHDAEKLVSKEEQMAMYQKYDCCVAIDEGASLYGCGTYNLPIYSSDGSDKIEYNLWMIDSNMYDETNGGYDYVHQDQLDWYVSKSNELKAQNGGEAVPSMMFQHIIVKEIYDIISEIPADKANDYQCVEIVNEDGSKQYFALNPENVKAGEMHEMPCPPTVNGGQFDAVVNQGDVQAMFFGHDHTNTFEVEYKGVDLVNTPGAGFNSYGDADRGVRVIDLTEGAEDYETEVVKYRELFADDKAEAERFVLYGSEYDDADRAAAFFRYIWFKVISIFSF